MRQNLINADKQDRIFTQLRMEIDRITDLRQACEVVVRVPLSPEGGIGVASMSVEKMRLKS